jgi:glycosyltransferase involved in cell wall biosynthesis
MRRDIKFSVVIPAYNAEKYISETLDSVQGQTYRNYEVVITDDGSTDNTSEIIKNYFKNFPGTHYKLIKQRNKGIGGARNSAVKETEGDFVAFLDADDKWSNEKLETVYDYIERHSDVDLICHNEYLVKDGKVISKLNYGPFRNYSYLLFRRNCISTSAVVVRRNKLFEAGLFSENIDFNGVEDYELWLRLSKICKIEYLPEALGKYTIQRDSITSNIVKIGRAHV